MENATKKCKCGCGEGIIIKPHHKYVGIPDFIKGHNNYVMAEYFSKIRSEQGKKRTAEGRNNHFIGNWKGKKRSEEQKNKQSKAMKGKYLGEKHLDHSRKMTELAKSESWGFRNQEHRITAQAKRKIGFNSGEKSGNYIHGRSHTRPYNAERQRCREANRRNQIPNDADTKAIFSFYEKARLLTLMTGEQYDVDHIIPISKGGAHHQDNLQVITHIENMRKGNRIMCKEAS